MFDEISPTYDTLNHIISGRQDLRWRRKAIKVLEKQSGQFRNILDLACGTGDLGQEFIKLRPDSLFSVDLSPEMLKIDKRKIRYSKNVQLKADASRLPFHDHFFDLIGISFGVRNFENLTKTIAEIRRILKKSGKFLTIEMFKSSSSGPSKSFLLKSFSVYFSKVVPKIGNIVSRSKYAYDYLFKSIDTFMTVREYTDLLVANGFKICNEKNNFIGIVNTIIAEKK